MALKIIPLPGCFEGADEFPQAVGCQQLFLCGAEIRVDNEMSLNDFGDFLFPNTAGSVV